MADSGVTRLHWPSLLLAMTIMLVGTCYPPSLLTADGRVHHGLASLLFCGMSAGFVRGVGFIPQQRVWRWLFSGWAVLGCVAWALWLRM